MKHLKYLGIALISLAGLSVSAHADWGWHRHRSPVVVVPGPGLIIDVGYHRDYYREHHHSIEVDVQLALSRLGYYRGPVDGDIGPGSSAAIRAYQYDRRLPVSGAIDGPLVRSLGL